jgi:hypothetical protein
MSLRCTRGERTTQIKEADDPKKAKKAAAAIEALIQKHHTQELYTWIQQVTHPNSGGGLQRVDIPKRDNEGNVVWDDEGNEVWEVLLEVDDTFLSRITDISTKPMKLPFHEVLRTPCCMTLLDILA